VTSEPRKVGLLVLNWNGAAVLPACLDTLTAAADASRHHFHLLLVDNGSRDGSAERAAQEQPRWDQLSLGENRGFAAGVNAGIRQLLSEDHDHICVVNNDVEADPGLLDPLVEELEADPRRGGVCPRIHYHAERDRIWYAGGAVSRIGLVSRHLGIRRLAEGRWLEAADTGYLTGCCLMGRAEFWKTTGGFDEAFGFYAEDVDLSLRARALGWTLRYAPSGLLYHRVGFSSGGGMSPVKLNAQRKAVATLLRRHLSPARRPLARLAWGLYWLRRGLAAMMRGERGVLGAMWRSTKGHDGPGTGRV
jgi:GT2 family glycosyltransferase